MSATFACPHCGATYPVKPVLVGRVVRCTTCRNAFVLRSNGTADKVAPSGEANQTGAAAPAPSPAAAPSAAPAAAKPSVPPRPPAPAPSPASRPAPSRPPASPSPDEIEVVEPVAADRRSTGEVSAAAAAAAAHSREARAKLNQAQEQARREMAGTLASAAAAALQAEKATQESAAAKGTQRSKRLAATGAKHESRKLSSVLVVGTGAQEAKDRRTLLLWSVGFLALIVVLICLIAYRSPARRALDDFCAPVGPTNAPYPRRLPAMQARTWTQDCNVLIDLGSVHIGATRTIDLHAVKPLITAMKSQVFLASHQIWVDPGSEAAVKKTWKDRLSLDDNLARLKSANIAAMTRTGMGEQLRAAGLSDEDADLLLSLVMPQSGAPQADALRLSQGETPDAMQITPFSGRHGQALRAAGNRYTYPTTDYSGILLRFMGDGWSHEQRVLRVNLTGDGTGL